MQRLTLLYVVGYLAVGGLGLLLVPDTALRLLGSRAAYGDVMPRVVGMFMLALGSLIYQFVRHRDYRYYTYTVVARSFVVIVLGALLVRTRDPLFLVLDAIVLVGLVPSLWVAWRTARPPTRPP